MAYSDKITFKSNRGYIEYETEPITFAHELLCSAMVPHCVPIIFFKCLYIRFMSYHLPASSS